MATYEVEHDIPAPTTTSAPPPRRPDLSTFFSALSQIDTSSTAAAPHHNPHAVPTPGDVAATFRTLADAFEVMRVEGGGGAQGGAGGNSELLESLISTLMGEAEAPPREVKGVGDEFLADPYPLVVRLPCHKSHIFDLECITPWLKLHPTCPLDRIDLVKKPAEEKLRREEEEKKKAAEKAGPGQGQQQEEDDEEEWDDMYA
ncbi:MAG: hypothetical protein M1819_001744 [Sarea resinae]|nr:MAG: hypothetical protein M1819_001744 [Sarea resinae]